MRKLYREAERANLALRVSARLIVDAKPGGYAALFLAPRDAESGVWLSRFYALHEASKKLDDDVSLGGFSPASSDEWNLPMTLDITILPSTRNGKRVLRELAAAKPIVKRRKP